MWAVQKLGNAALSVAGFVRRRKKLVIGVGALGVAAYVAVRKVRAAYNELADRVEEQQLEEARLETYLRSNQRACAVTVLSLLPELRRKLAELFDVEALTARLKSGSGSLSSSERQQIWERLKVISFARSISAVYALCITDALLRTQLCILARYLFLSAAASSRASSSAQTPAPSVSNETQQRFLQRAEYIQAVGLARLAARVERAAEEALKEVTLRATVDLPAVAAIVARVRAAVEREGSTTPGAARHPPPGASPLVEYMCEGSSEAGLFGTGSFPRCPGLSVEFLTAEMLDHLESPELADVLRASLDAAFAAFADTQLAPLFAAPAPGPPAGPAPAEAAAAGGSGGGAAGAQLPLPRVIPGVANALGQVLAGPPGNGALEAIHRLPAVREYAALVYSSG